jgi:ABC-type transport system involved in multi-copper enzyme maturation permease subunit
MGIRWGPGPVFVFESIIAARKWQIYALRSLFVTMILIGVWSTWRGIVGRFGGLDVPPSQMRRLLSEFGEQLYQLVAAIQVTMVLLAAPASTAGAICLDRARGTLAHVLATDLTSTEIVLGKLAARLTPIVGLIAASVPVLAIGLLLGGVIPEAVATLFVASIALAMLGASLALLVSVRVGKSHEVLMVVYSAWFLALMSAPLWAYISRGSDRLPGPPDWFWMLNPYVLVYAPYSWAARFSLVDVALYLTVNGALTVLISNWAIRILRREPKPQRVRSERWENAWQTLRSRAFSWIPSPTLEGNPVLWREWHRNRPSRTARRVWGLYIVGSVVATFIGLQSLISDGVSMGPPDVIGYNMFQVAIGLLFLSVMAPTAFSEERVRGSLDVLMSTPLSTASIVLGKWWGTFRVVPKLAFLPALGSGFFAFVLPEIQAGGFGIWRVDMRIDTVDRVMVGVLPILWIFAHGAMITSLGLALATWFKRPARALTLSVVYYIAITVGTILVVEMIIAPIMRNYWPLQQSVISTSTPAQQAAWQAAWQNWQARIQCVTQSLTSLSPMGGQIIPAQVITGGFVGPYHKLSWPIQSGLIAGLIMTAAALLGLTILTFDRCLGRMREGPSTEGVSPGAGPRRMAGIAPRGVSAGVSSEAWGGESLDCARGRSSS